MNQRQVMRGILSRIDTIRVDRDGWRFVAGSAPSQTANGSMLAFQDLPARRSGVRQRRFSTPLSMLFIAVDIDPDVADTESSATRSRQRGAVKVDVQSGLVY